MQVFLDREPKNRYHPTEPIDIDGSQIVHWDNPKVSIADALRKMLKQLRLVWAVRDGVVWITKGARGGNFDLQRLVAYRFSVPVPAEALPHLLGHIETINVSSWDRVGGYGSTAVVKDILFVRHCDSVHRLIVSDFGHLLRPLTPVSTNHQLTDELADRLRQPVMLHFNQATLEEVAGDLGKQAGIEIRVATSKFDAGTTCTTSSPLKLPLESAR